jgi:hypothetical protein
LIAGESGNVFDIWGDAINIASRLEIPRESGNSHFREKQRLSGRVRAVDFSGRNITQGQRGLEYLFSGIIQFMRLTEILCHQTH